HTGKTLHLCETQTRFVDLSLAAIDLGFKLEPVSAAKWHSLSMQLFEENPLEHPLADYLNAFDSTIVEMMTWMSERPLNLSCKKTDDLLSSMAISQIEVTGDVLKECVAALQEVEIIPLLQKNI
ncbi:MAG: hypothetical protein KAR45_02095, partial [Desulfobacteraceae bacterium]|nr:hypothetical protein [Desulfobacteraceae bacterium]